MKRVFLLSGLFAIVVGSSFCIKLLSGHQNDIEIHQFQRDVLRLFQYINKHDYYSDQLNIAVYYDIEDNIDNYTVPDAVREFVDLNRLGFLPKDEIFSIFNGKHRKEVISLFKIFYYARDYATLYKTACWARVFMNEALFIYAFSVALVQRPDTEMIDLPPIYEVYPEYFYNTNVIQSAREARRLYKDLPRLPALEENKFTGITIDAISSHYNMSYLTEDVGFNAYYYYNNIYYPFWLPNDMINFRTEKRGEQFYYITQQLLARYYLERLSNGLGDISILDYLTPIRNGYYPSMTYPNGMTFPKRPNNTWIIKERASQNVLFDNNYTNSYMFVRDYERRISDAIDLGYVPTSNGRHISLYDADGLNILGNMVEGNVESPNARFYGGLQAFARLLLGNSQLSSDTYQIVPSALEQFETSLRDPIFYEFSKRIILYFQRYLNNMQSYSTEELLMPGVKIEDVEVDHLATYFEYFYVDISNAVYNKQFEENFEDVPVRVKQMRLNSRPFNYILSVRSDSRHEALVKVFLGPKYDERGRRLEITESRLNFVELDKFTVVLNSGINRIQRSSRDNFYSKDHISFRSMYKNESEYESNAEWNMPRRLLLPKGTKKGLMYRMYFIITPYQALKDQSLNKNLKVSQSNRVLDNYPLGYPLDRPIDENVFYVSNSFFKDVTIYNEEIKDKKL